MILPVEKHPRVSAIVPARNEAEVIRECVESLAQQPEINEILVVNDQSKDGTVEVVRRIIREHPQVRLLENVELPPGWVGKNSAAWRGAREATGEWLLFTDADAVHADDSVRKALEIAATHNAAEVSFSPEQQMKSWYEKSLIPYVYCRLARKFSFDEVNDPQNPAAAANGQFLMIRRDAYEAVGGHASVAADVVEDVALAKRVKQAGYRVWFGTGKGIVRVRMYRSFDAMVEGWKKNLFRLMGGSGKAMRWEIIRALMPGLTVFLVTVLVGELLQSKLAALVILAAGIGAILLVDGRELRRNSFPARLCWYGSPGRILFSGVLWASYRSHRKGKLEWKGREYPVGIPRASKG
jgi:glycosyltransferase involved in cell wall biosynthesis